MPVSAGRAVSAAGPEAFQGTYDTRANIFSFALRWKMDAGKKR